MTPDWLKFKKYPHIGEPLTKKRDSGWIIRYVTNPQLIAKHKFTPLLHKKIYQRKYRPDKNAPKKNGKRVRSVQKRKERPIFYASHLDSILYSYYCYKLTSAYEDYIRDESFNLSPVAYRKIPVGPSSNSNKCNIEFAYDTFIFIENNKHRKLSVIVADVTSFFDNLDHRILHKQWKRVLNVDSLPDDHYNIYKSLITKRFVNENELFNKFKHKLIAERGVVNDSTKIRLRNINVKHNWYLKKERVVAYCTKKDFFNEATHLIRAEKACSHQHKKCRNNCTPKGIPQGTPMSATLANIYMLDFDKTVFNECQKRNSYYQRYSDDLIIVCDQENEQYFFNLIRKSVEKTAKLEIHPNKTNIYRYETIGKNFNGGILEEDNSISDRKQLEYLGFEYDGKKVRVKTVGFSKFYRSMKRSLARGVHFASMPYNKTNKLFEERLYRRFTYKGAKRRLIFKRDLKSGEFYKSKEQYWGNYISYLEKANRIMRPINGDDSIKKQYSKFWNNFHLEMKKSYLKIGKNLLKFRGYSNKN
ncbi:reverse transcriptase domain-containing protein [Maribacter aestuarii]|uniref:reverse transcriptase domain-containing protein n=1 Tax=Maribacter aestuarii TaxID=1130723 RepID=UPI0025A671D5|nr:reverse transcriptase domain-containing protein [Maribacter aestuarii]